MDFLLPLQISWWSWLSSFLFSGPLQTLCSNSGPRLAGSAAAESLLEMQNLRSLRRPTESGTTMCTTSPTPWLLCIGKTEEKGYNSGEDDPLRGHMDHVCGPSSHLLGARRLWPGLISTLCRSVVLVDTNHYSCNHCYLFQCPQELADWFS